MSFDSLLGASVFDYLWGNFAQDPCGSCIYFAGKRDWHFRGVTMMGLFQTVFCPTALIEFVWYLKQLNILFLWCRICFWSWAWYVAVLQHTGGIRTVFEQACTAFENVHVLVMVRYFGSFCTCFAIMFTWDIALLFSRTPLSCTSCIQVDLWY